MTTTHATTIAKTNLVLGTDAGFGVDQRTPGLAVPGLAGSHRLPMSREARAAGERPAAGRLPELGVHVGYAERAGLKATAWRCLMPSAAAESSRHR